MDAPEAGRGGALALERSGRVDVQEEFGSDLPGASAAAAGRDDFSWLLPVARPRPARGRFTILDLAPISRQRANDCRFMRGRFFCGGRTQAGASWCDTHAAVVFEASAGATGLLASAGGALSGKVDTGFPKENATKYAQRDRFAIHPIGKRSRGAER